MQVVTMQNGESFISFYPGPTARITGNVARCLVAEESPGAFHLFFKWYTLVTRRLLHRSRR